MTRLPEAVVGDAYANSGTWDHLTNIVEVGNRMAGQEGEKRGARVVADALTEHARDVTVAEFDIDGWWRGSSAVAVGDPYGHAFDRDHEVIALPGTTAGEVEAELVDVGYGLPDDIGPEVDGCVVLARTDSPDDGDRFVHRLEKYAAAVRNGAVGFIFRNHVRGALPPTGEIGWGRRPSPTPAVGVSAELGARLARYAAEGDPTVRLSVDCRNEPSTSVVVDGAVGPETERAVLVTAHVDGHDIAEGARDNGVGCALVVEIGRLLARIEDNLDTRVRLVAFGSEEIGLLGAEHVAARDADAVECVLNVDGAGESRTPSVRTYGYGGMAAAFEAVGDDLDVPVETREVRSPHTDAWPFAVRGIPAVTAGSATEGDDRGWGHTHADTLDKLDSRDLRDLAVVYASAAAELASDGRDVEHVPPAAFRDAVPAHTERELTFFDRWVAE